MKTKKMQAFFLFAAAWSLMLFTFGEGEEQGAVADLLTIYETFPTQPKVSVLGDSYSTFAGSQPEGYAVYYKDGKNGVTDRSMVYWAQFIAAMGGTLEVNNSWSGSLVSRHPANDTTPMIDAARLANLGNPDILLLFGGTNDAWNNAPRGESIDCYDSANWTEENLKTFRPAYAYLLNWLLTNKPDMQIIAIVNTTDDVGNQFGAPGLREGYANDIKEIAAHYGVLSVQLAGISKSDAHPDVLGHKAIGEQIMRAYRMRELAGGALAETATGTRVQKAYPVVVGTRTSDADGFQRIVHDTDANIYYRVVAVTNPNCFATYSLPANAMVEYLAVGGGAAGGAAGVSAAVCGGNAGEVRDGFLLTKAECEVVVKVGGGGEPTTGSNTNLGRPGGATYFRLGNADIIEAAGGLPKSVETAASASYGGTGGDGAGGAGTQSTSEQAGCGGDAVLRYTTGEKAAYAGGGTGWKRSAKSHGTGGAAGGITVGGYLIGTKESVTDDSHKNGVANTGSGGAAGSVANGNFSVGSGAAGIAVFRYAVAAPENAVDEKVEEGGEGEDPGGEPSESEEPGEPEEPEEECFATLSLVPTSDNGTRTSGCALLATVADLDLGEYDHAVLAVSAYDSTGVAAGSATLPVADDGEFAVWVPQLVSGRPYTFKAVLTVGEKESAIGKGAAAANVLGVAHLHWINETEATYPDSEGGEWKAVSEQEARFTATNAVGQAAKALSAVVTPVLCFESATPQPPALPADCHLAVRAVEDEQGVARYALWAGTNGWVVSKSVVAVLNEPVELRITVDYAVQSVRFEVNTASGYVALAEPLLIGNDLTDRIRGFGLVGSGSYSSVIADLYSKRRSTATMFYLR